MSLNFGHILGRNQDRWAKNTRRTGDDTQRISIKRVGQGLCCALHRLIIYLSLRVIPCFIVCIRVKVLLVTDFILVMSFLLIITSDKGGGKCDCPRCLSVRLLARLLKKACMDLDEVLRVDRSRHMDGLINF